MEDWNAEPPDNGVGVEILADIYVALHEGLGCGATRYDIGVEILGISTSLFMKVWNAVPPDNDVGEENVPDIYVALHDGLERGAARKNVE